MHSAGVKGKQLASPSTPSLLVLQAQSSRQKAELATARGYRQPPPSPLTLKTLVPLVSHMLPIIQSSKQG